jgi:hypothetical protein
MYIYFLICPWPILIGAFLFTTLSRRFIQSIRIFLLCLPFWIHYLFPIYWKTRDDCYPSTFARLRLAPLRSPPTLFSVHIRDATPTSSNAYLSTVHIPIQWYPPAFQHSMKDDQRVRLRRRSRKTWWMLPLGLLLFCQTPSVYAIPGTSHAFVSEPSLDASRQESLRETVIQNSVSHSHQELLHPTPDHGSLSLDSSLPTDPHCFVVDTDSHMFLVDSGANAVIVNDVDLLDNFQPAEGGVQGIGGKAISLKGSGTCAVPLHFDDGSTHTAHRQHARCLCPGFPLQHRSPATSTTS